MHLSLIIIIIIIKKNQKEKEEETEHARTTAPSLSLEPFNFSQKWLKSSS
jgi:hypothetical protein